MAKAPQRRRAKPVPEIDGKKQLTSSRQLPMSQRAQNSKFSRRFHMTGNGMSVAAQEFKEESSRIGTPSTQASASGTPASSDGMGDMNQWIKKPAGLGVLGQQILDGSMSEDTQQLY